MRSGRKRAAFRWTSFIYSTEPAEGAERDMTYSNEAATEQACIFARARGGAEYRSGPIRTKRAPYCGGRGQSSIKVALITALLLTLYHLLAARVCLVLLVRLSNAEGDLYFPPYRSHVRGKPTKTYAGWSKDKKAFDKRCGVSKWTLHDLHRTFATKLAELGVLPHVVERLLNHRRALSKLKTF